MKSIIIAKRALKWRSESDEFVLRLIDQLLNNYQAEDTEDIMNKLDNIYDSATLVEAYKLLEKDHTGKTLKTYLHRA